MCFGNAGCRLQEFRDVLLTLYCWLSFNITLASSKFDDKWYKYGSPYLSICIKLSHWFTQTLTWHTLILFPFPCNLNANKNYKPLKHQHGNYKVVRQTIHLLVMLSTDTNLCAGSTNLSSITLGKHIIHYSPPYNRVKTWSLSSILFSVWKISF